MPIGPSFDGVLAAAQTGAAWAWDVLYKEFAGPVRGYLTARGAADPDNALGEVFLQVARNIKTFHGDEARFRSWLFMIAHHRLIDERRSRRRRREELMADEAHFDVAAAPTRSAEDDAVDNLTVEDIRRLLSTLSPAQQDVLTLRIVGGLTIAEIAEILGKRQGAVKALQRRGVETLRKRLERGVPF